MQYACNAADAVTPPEMERMLCSGLRRLDRLHPHERVGRLEQCADIMVERRAWVYASLSGFEGSVNSVLLGFVMAAP